MLSMLVLVTLLTLQFSDRTSFHSSPRAYGTEAGEGEQRDRSLSGLDVFAQALAIVQSDFVDTTKLDPDRLMVGAIRGMLSTLEDPHVRYLLPPDAKELTVLTDGEFGGIGISIGIEAEQLTVISPLEGTPAWKAGVESGDVIAEINGETTAGLALEDAVKILRGTPGTEVAIGLLRRGFPEMVEVTLVREIIQVKSVRHSTIDGLGYVRISTFSEQTALELDEALGALSHASITGLIVDLRHNSGGVLNGAVAVTDRFMDSGTIVSIKSRDPRHTVTYSATAGGVVTRLPLVVLVDNGSASASEIVSGAIQDHARGVIVGKKTYGKGSVQTVEDLPDGSKIALTTARYFTPSGRSIHGVGLDPDVEVDVQAVSDSDRVALQTLFDSPLIREFAFGMTDYSPSDLARLEEEVRKAGVVITGEILEWQLIRQLSRQNDSKMYLIPRLDPQLQKAIGILKAERILAPKIAVKY